jgi:hypothetical protein
MAWGHDFGKEFTRHLQFSQMLSHYPHRVVFLKKNCNYCHIHMLLAKARSDVELRSANSTAKEPITMMQKEP